MRILFYLKWSMFILLLHIKTSSSNIFCLEDIDTPSHARHYNLLPSVEEAYSALKEQPTKKVFRDVQEILIRYGIESHIGLRLIHKHFSLRKGQIVLEEFQDIKGIPSLVTSAQPWEEALKKKALPSSWIFHGNEGIDVFETSVDPAVLTGIELIKNNVGVLDEVWEKLSEYKLTHLLSLAILKRTSLEASETQIYLESNILDNSKSIVQLWGRNAPKPYSILDTSWNFNGPKEKSRIVVQAGCIGKTKPKNF